MANIAILTVIVTVTLFTLVTNIDDTHSQSPNQNQDSSPVANDMEVSIQETSSPVIILLNASDPDNNIKNYTIITDPVNGHISRFDQDTGTVTYQPSSSLNSQTKDVFTYRVIDDTGAKSNIGKITISVQKQAGAAAG